jgi:hypothetical protein
MISSQRLPSAGSATERSPPKAKIAAEVAWWGSYIGRTGHFNEAAAIVAAEIESRPPIAGLPIGFNEAAAKSPRKWICCAKGARPRSLGPTPTE